MVGSSPVCCADPEPDDWVVAEDAALVVVPGEDVSALLDSPAFVFPVQAERQRTATAPAASARDDLAVNIFALPLALMMPALMRLPLIRCNALDLVVDGAEQPEAAGEPPDLAIARGHGPGDRVAVAADVDAQVDLLNTHQLMMYVSGPGCIGVPPKRNPKHSSGGI